MNLSLLIGRTSARKAGPIRAVTDAVGGALDVGRRGEVEGPCTG